MSNKRKAVDDLKKILAIHELNEQQIELMQELRQLSEDEIKNLKGELNEKKETIDALSKDKLWFSDKAARLERFFNAAQDRFNDIMAEKNATIRKLQDDLIKAQKRKCDLVCICGRC